MKRLPLILAALVLIAGGFTIKTYNGLQRADESVAAAWAEVENQYQRRADLVPNLVETVKGYAKHEQTLLTEITAARARVSSIAPTPEMLSDAAALERYRAAQSELGNGLARLLAVSENYPDLKADNQLAALREEIASTENRIAFSRQHYNDSVTEYNSAIEQFPANIIAGMFGFRVAELLEIEDIADKRQPVQVKFD